MQNGAPRRTTKMRHLAMLALAALLTFSAASARAGGSFSVDEFMLILEQQPAIAQWIADSLDLDETGTAMRIGQEVNPNLGGMRIGPYTILAKPKGADGPFTLELTMETQMDCLDDSGNSVEFDKATAIEESFDYLTIRPYSE